MFVKGHERGAGHWPQRARSWAPWRHCALPSGIEPDTSALLAAIATAWALDITPDLMAAGIKTFDYQA